MFSWLRRTKSTPLTGAPAVRRRKTYSAQSGYVYEYFYEGKRTAARERDPGTEFVFEVSTDRKSSFPACVFVSEASVASWQESRGRILTDTERYAIAKMALFQAFDERPSPADMKADVQLRAADAEAILETLGID